MYIGADARTHRQIALNGIQRHVSDRDQTFLFAFASQPDHPGVPTEIIPIHAHQFTDARAG